MKILNLLTLSLIVMGLSIHPETISGMNGKLLAGTAKVNITPKTTTPLHDSLYARCVVLDLNGERLAFVSVDLAIYTNDRLQNECKEKYGVSELMLCSSHTHSGFSDPKSTLVEEQIMSAIGFACNHMFPAKICAGRSSFPQLGFNRLVVREDGHSRESW